jgi:Co/Zn/Cd efflux system component
LADALTSVLAVFALLAAKYFGLIWMDPLMGIIGAVLVTRWAVGLIRETSHILLDKAGPEHIQRKLREDIEKDGDSKITDLHLWSVGPNIYSAVISVVASNTLEPDEYKSLIPSDLGLVHIAVEVHKCKEPQPSNR